MFSEKEYTNNEYKTILIINFIIQDVMMIDADKVHKRKNKSAI